MLYTEDFANRVTYLILQLLLLMILIYVVTYVHIITSDFHDIGLGSEQCTYIAMESSKYALYYLNDRPTPNIL